MEFSTNLRELREEKRLTQKELAKACNLSPQCISALEKGINSPTATTLSALSKFFELSVDELMGNDNISEKEKANGIDKRAIYISDEEFDWLELRSQVIEVQGEKYLNTLIAMIKAGITENSKKKP